MSDKDADTIVILSSELISKITEEYFNKTMFKQKVEIVDLKPTETGYMFSIAFVARGKRGISDDVPSTVDILERFVPSEQVVPLTSPGIDFEGDGITNRVVGVRDKNGKFTKVTTP